MRFKLIFIYQELTETVDFAKKQTLSLSKFLYLLNQWRGLVPDPGVPWETAGITARSPARPAEGGVGTKRPHLGIAIHVFLLSGVAFPRSAAVSARLGFLRLEIL